MSRIVSVVLVAMLGACRVWAGVADECDHTDNDLQFLSLVYIVEIPLVVWDDTGGMVLNITREDVEVKENGQPVQLESLRQVDFEDLWVVLVMDGSLSTKDFLWALQKAAVELVTMLPAYARIAVLEFRQDARVVVPFTADRHMVEQAVRGIEALGRTDVVVGIEAAIRHLGDKPGRRAVMLFSDGMHEPELCAGNQVVKDIGLLSQRAAAAGIRVYSVAQGYPCNEALLEKVAHGTGGYYLHLSAPNLRRAIQHMVVDLAPSYLAIYRAPRLQFDGSWHEVAVTSRQGKWDIAHKRGYFLSLDELGETIHTLPGGN
ncbi:VWA domain-containing protein [bacterium]|nr:VWA domain-containing protein [candidate division CSSED10-310 bacterium]